MSLLSSDVSIVARAGAAASGKTQIDELYAKLTVAAAVFFISLEIAYLVMAGLPPIGKSWFDKPWVDGTHFVLGRDFLNFWMGGRSVFGDGPAPCRPSRRREGAKRRPKKRPKKRPMKSA
jgi:hypothetical protein